MAGEICAQHKGGGACITVLSVAIQPAAGKILRLICGNTFPIAMSVNPGALLPSDEALTDAALLSQQQGRRCMMQRNGRKQPSPEARVKAYIMDAFRRKSENFQVVAERHGYHLTITSDYGDIEVQIVEQTPFQNSHAVVTLPGCGKYLSYLRGANRNGAIGHTPVKPVQLEVHHATHNCR